MSGRQARARRLADPEAWNTRVMRRGRQEAAFSLLRHRQREVFVVTPEDSPERALMKTAAMANYKPRPIFMESYSPAWATFVNM